MINSQDVNFPCHIFEWRYLKGLADVLSMIN